MPGNDESLSFALGFISSVGTYTIIATTLRWVPIILKCRNTKFDHSGRIQLPNVKESSISVVTYKHPAGWSQIDDRATKMSSFSMRVMVVIIST